MPAHHLGERRQVSVRVHPSIVDKIEAACRSEGVTSNSQYVADLLAEHFGMDELIRQRGKAVEPDLLTA